MFSMRPLLAAVATTLAFASPAAADEWSQAPLLDDPIVAESWPLAVQYWASVPDVPALASFCPNGVPIHVIAHDSKYAGYGSPCDIWFEFAFLQTLAAWESVNPYVAAQQRCYTLIHELGHALGLPHSPDPTNVMYGEWGVIPQVCIDYWQPPRPVPGVILPPTPIPAPPPPEPAIVKEPEQRTIKRREAIRKVRSKLGKRWRYTTEVAGTSSSDGGATWRNVVIEVTAKRKRCVKRRCKTTIKTYWVEYHKTRLRMMRVIP